MTFNDDMTMNQTDSTVGLLEKTAIDNNGNYLLSYIKRFEHTKIPFVLMGDFNVEIDHPLHKPLLDNYKEAYTTLKIKRPNTLTLKSIETDQSLMDDHYPVIAELL